MKLKELQSVFKSKQFDSSNSISLAVFLSTITPSAVLQSRQLKQLPCRACWAVPAPLFCLVRSPWFRASADCPSVRSSPVPPRCSRTKPEQTWSQIFCLNHLSCRNSWTWSCIYLWLRSPEQPSSWRRCTWSQGVRSWTTLWRFVPSPTQLVLNKRCRLHLWLPWASCREPRCRSLPFLLHFHRNCDSVKTTGVSLEFSCWGTSWDQRLRQWCSRSWFAWCPGVWVWLTRFLWKMFSAWSRTSWMRESRFWDLKSK